MTYHKFLSIAAAALLTIAVGCDNKSSEEADAAGSDGAADSIERPSGSTDDAQPADASDASESANGRPSATANESGTISEKPPLETEHLLTPEDITSLADGEKFERTALPGLEASPTYNAHRVKPRESDGYGAGVQVWAFDDKSTADQRINELKTQYLNVKPAPKEAKTLGSSAFVSTRGGVESLVFRTANPSTRVIAISCSTDICTEPDHLVALATKVGKRLKGSGD